MHNSKNRAAVKDPVCGMSVDPASAAGAYPYAGQEYFFCSLHCLERFRTRPETYLNKPLVQLSLTAEASKTTGPAAISPVRCIPKSGKRRPDLVPDAAWPWSRARVAPQFQVRTTPVRCTRKSCDGAGSMPHLRNGARAARDRW